MRCLIIIAYSMAIFFSCTSVNPVAVNGSFDGALAINEFMVQNSKESGVLDCEGKSEDWVELYNNGKDSLYLKNYYISDMASVPLKKQLPDTVIVPGGVFVLWGGTTQCIHKNHLGFSFSTDPSKAEKILVFRADSVVMDSVSYLYNKDAMSDINSYGRITDGSVQWGKQTAPTPGMPNR